MADDYHYAQTAPVWDDGYIHARVEHWLEKSAAKDVFELGCGNGFTLKRLSVKPYRLSAIEVSESGVAQARINCPSAHIELASVYDDLASKFGTFDAIVSVDVVEHLYDPHSFARRCHELLRPGGVALVSTPYHGYLKNLAIALTNKFDAHVDPLWHHGHIKFFSRKTLALLMQSANLETVAFERLGRIPWLAKSLFGVFRKAK